MELEKQVSKWTVKVIEEYNMEVNDNVKRMSFKFVKGTDTIDGFKMEKFKEYECTFTVDSTVDQLAMALRLIAEKADEFMEK